PATWGRVSTATDIWGSGFRPPTCSPSNCNRHASSRLPSRSGCWESSGMPRSIDVSFRSPASVEQIHSAFGEEDYWMARIAAFGGSKTLDSLIVEPDGTVTVSIIEDLRHGGLPKILATLYPGDMNVRSTEKWSAA